MDHCACRMSETGFVSLRASSLMGLLVLCGTMGFMLRMGGAGGIDAKEVLETSGGLRLVDSNGGMRAFLRVEDQGVSLSLCDGDGRERLGLTVEETGSSRVSLLSTDGSPRLEFMSIVTAARPGGAQAIVFTDANGVERLGIAQGGPLGGITIRDDLDQMRFSLLQHEGGDAVMHLMDDEGEFLSPVFE